MPAHKTLEAIMASTDCGPLTDEEFSQLVTQVTELKSTFAGIRRRIEGLQTRLHADQQALRQP